MGIKINREDHPLVTLIDFVKSLTKIEQDSPGLEPVIVRLNPHHSIFPSTHVLCSYSKCLCVTVKNANYSMIYSEIETTISFSSIISLLEGVVVLKGPTFLFSVNYIFPFAGGKKTRCEKYQPDLMSVLRWTALHAK